MDTITKTAPGGALFRVLADGEKPQPGRGVTQVVVTSNDVAVLKVQPMKNGQPDPGIQPGAFAALDASGEVMLYWSGQGDGRATITVTMANAGSKVVGDSGEFVFAGPTNQITATSKIELVEGRASWPLRAG